MGRARRGAIDASVAFIEPSFVPRDAGKSDIAYMHLKNKYNVFTCILVGGLVSRDYANEHTNTESSERLGVREVRRRSASDASLVHESPSCE